MASRKLYLLVRRVFSIGLAAIQQQFDGGGVRGLLSPGLRIVGLQTMVPVRYPKRKPLESEITFCGIRY